MPVKDGQCRHSGLRQMIRYIEPILLAIALIEAEQTAVLRCGNLRN
jgi:hypothetical protein